MNKLNPKITMITFLMVIGLITVLRSETQAQQKSPPELKFGGYVKVDFIQDFDPIGNQFQFKTDAIPVEGTLSSTQSGQTTIHARETRFTLTLLEDTPKGKLHAYIECAGPSGLSALRNHAGAFAGRRYPAANPV